MKRLLENNINCPTYWNSHQTAVDFGLRQREYARLTIGDSILELGCGLSPFLEQVNVRLKAGLDFSTETIKRCLELYPSVVYVQGSATETPFVFNQFDTVVAGELIEHVDNPVALVSEMKRIAKKRIVLSTPILEFDDPEHIWQFSIDDLKELVGEAYEIKSERFPGRSYLFAYCDL